MRNASRVLVAVAAAVVTSHAFAQQSEWRITPYLWNAGFDGTLGVPDSDGSRIEVNSDNVKFKTVGFMLHANYRTGRWSAFGDWTYANVKADAPSPREALYAGADFKVHGNVVEANVGYDLLGTPGTSLDVFGGLRYYALNAELKLRQGVLAEASRTGDSDWVDGVVGARFQTRFAPNWDLFASADVGGGGSDLAWQVFGGVAYQFSWGSLVVGWRHLHVDYDHDRLKLDAALTGPLIGASFKF